MAFKADRASIRGKDNPILESKMELPVFFNIFAMSSGDKAGFFWSNKAATAAAWGEAWEVPPKVLNPPSIQEEVIIAPGARRSITEETLLKHAILSAQVV